MNKKSIYNFDLETLEIRLSEFGLKKFVAKQLFKWIYQKKIENFSLMTDLSKKTVEICEQNFYFDKQEIVKVLQDENDDTTKFLFKLHDGNCIESVVMRFDYGFTVCISTQVGCNMGCKFCASGLLKKQRDLDVNEILLQYIWTNNYVFKKFNQNISNIVIMGIGEPFDNFNNLMTSLKVFTNHNGLGIGSRRITVSTCGLCDKILKFAQLMPQINLAISLHASNDKVRNTLMPINKKYNIDKIIETCNEYLKITNRRITFEYLLLKDINDTEQHALELVNKLKDLLCYVNIIPYNNVDQNDFQRSTKIKNFFNLLNKNGLQATIRLERGQKIDAACGQLRVKHEQN